MKSLPALKRATDINGVLACIDNLLRDKQFISDHIYEQYKKESSPESGYSPKQALLAAKQRVVSANGGSTRTWLSFNPLKAD